jgi:threonylcarbamoyladenosine tRNA methylthiotransferase MtaB
LAEVRGLTEAGCREIVLTGIETASYGKDLEGYTLADLLEEIDRIPNVGRIRLGSLDPSLIKEPFVQRIAALRSITPHFHLSMQSGSDKVLALMKRKYNTRMALKAMELLRGAMPTVQFTTDMIVGFPQESDEDFAQTMEFVKQARFLMIHVFPYSKRSGTPAAVMSGQIPEPIKHERAAQLSQVEAEIRRDILDSLTGSVTDVLFETYSDGYACGHSAEFVEIHCKCDEPMQAQTRTVTITHNDGNVCYATLTHA